MFKNSLVWLSLCFHAVWLAVFSAFFWVSTGSSPSIIIRGLGWLGLPASRDSIALAADLGRLDMISMSLTILGAVLALAALGSYFVMRHTVVQTTRETTREEVAANIPVEVKKTITIDMLIEALKSDPVLLEMLQRAVRDGDISDTLADDIAASMEEDKNE